MTEDLHEVTIYLDIQADTRGSGEKPIYTFRAQIRPTEELNVDNLIEELRVALWDYMKSWSRLGAGLTYEEGPRCE